MNRNLFFVSANKDIGTGSCADCIMYRVRLCFLTAEDNIPMGWIEILIFMCVAGMFGGILDVLQTIDIRKLIEQDTPALLSRKRFVAALFLGATAGVGGSIAMLFIIVAAAKLDTEASVKNRLMLISLGMISGFLGYRVLRPVALRVKSQIDEAESRTEKKIEEKAARVEASTQQKIEESTIHLREGAEYSEAISLGLLVAEKKDADLSTNNRAVSKLERIIERAPADRQASIILSNIYAKLGDYESAIKILDDLIKVLETKGEDRKKDIADASYNIACLLNNMADKREASDPERQKLRGQVYAYLERAIQLNPLNKEEARKDPDLKSLMAEERFTQIVA